jgi:hypothetical protein
VRISIGFSCPAAVFPNVALGSRTQRGQIREQVTTPSGTSFTRSASKSERLVPDQNFRIG